MYSGMAGLEKRKLQDGFTLVELITVVAIISLLVVFMTIQVGRTNDDAKLGIATSFLLGNVPSAIGSYKSRHMSSCTNLPDGDASATNSDKKTVTELLHDRGLVANTPWDVAWTAFYTNGVRQITVDFPTTGSEDVSQAAADLAANVNGQIQVVKATVNSGNDGVVVIYNCM